MPDRVPGAARVLRRVACSSGGAGPAEGEADGALDARPFVTIDHPLRASQKPREAAAGRLVPGARIRSHGLASNQRCLSAVADQLERSDARQDGPVDLGQLVGHRCAFHVHSIGPDDSGGNSPLVPILERHSATKR